jgi:PAS domain S-box-containing protein
VCLGQQKVTAMNDINKPASPVSPLRKRAEAALQHRLAGLENELEVVSPEDTRRVLDELRVYQLELEMQNEELRRALAQLDTTRSSYFDLYDLAPVGYCTISEGGLIVQANLTASTLLGVPRAEIILQPISRFIEYHDQTVYYSHRSQLLRSGQAQSFDVRMNRANGTTFWAHIDAVAAEGNPGEPALRIMISDVSVRMKMEMELVAALDAAQVANRARELFISNMSHEFRTPMNIILGLCEILQQKPGDPKNKVRIDSIKQAANQLLVILNNLLDFSKLESGELALHGSEFDFRDFIEQVVAHHRQLARAKGLEFHVAVDSSIPERMSADHDRLKLVMDNLLGNAVKFTATGAISVHASTVQVKPDQVILKFEIQNTGVEIDDEKQKIIFAPFVQGDSSSTRAFSGTGIGLSISQKLVRLMGGEIGMTSRSGEGNTFWFTVPLQRVLTNAGAASATAGLE